MQPIYDEFSPKKRHIIVLICSTLYTYARIFDINLFIIMYDIKYTMYICELIALFLTF